MKFYFTDESEWGEQDSIKYEMKVKCSRNKSNEIIDKTGKLTFFLYKSFFLAWYGWWGDK